MSLNKFYLKYIIFFIVIQSVACKHETPVLSLSDELMNKYQMVLVEGGTFTMGCTPEQGTDCLDIEKPAHQTTVKSFYISKFELTQKLWTEIMGYNPSIFKKGDNFPVEFITRTTIDSFLVKINKKYKGCNFRLPTEAEWEYAAKGGNKSNNYKYSGSNNRDTVAWYTLNSKYFTHQVGTKAANELGIFDMSGNVWEWCSNYFYEYDPEIQLNIGDSTKKYYILRGGCWDNRPKLCRTTYRSITDFDYISSNCGFRLAHSLAPVNF